MCVEKRCIVYSSSETKVDDDILPFSTTINFPFTAEISKKEQFLWPKCAIVDNWFYAQQCRSTKFGCIVSPVTI